MNGNNQWTTIWCMLRTLVARGISDLWQTRSSIHRFGRRNVLAVAAFIVGTCNSGSALLGNYWGFLILRVVIGAFCSVCVNNGTILSKYIANSRSFSQYHSVAYITSLPIFSCRVLEVTWQDQAAVPYWIRLFSLYHHCWIDILFGFTLETVRALHGGFTRSCVSQHTVSIGKIFLWAYLQNMNENVSIIIKSCL